MGLGYNTLIVSGSVIFRRAGPVLVFGAFIDVPLIVGGFLLMYRYKGRITHEVLKVKLPPLALSLIVSVPLIIFEEQIDCMPTWCGAVLIPPTLPFLFVEIIILAWLVMWRKAMNVKLVTLAYSIFGVLFEIFLGGLVGAPPLIIAIIGPYVMIGYGFISLLPLSVLVEGRKLVQRGRGAVEQQVASLAVGAVRAWSQAARLTMKMMKSYS